MRNSYCIGLPCDFVSMLKFLYENAKAILGSVSLFFFQSFRIIDRNTLTENALLKNEFSEHTCVHYL